MEHGRFLTGGHGGQWGMGMGHGRFLILTGHGRRQSAFGEVHAISAKSSYVITVAREDALLDLPCCYRYGIP